MHATYPSGSGHGRRDKTTGGWSGRAEKGRKEAKYVHTYILHTAEGFRRTVIRRRVG